MNTFDLDKTYIAGTYKRFPVEIVSGKGSLVKDVNGKEYIDMGSGIAVTSFGVADPEWIAAVETQIHRVQHMSNLYYTEPCAKLAEALCTKTGMEYSVLCLDPNAAVMSDAIKKKIEEFKKEGVTICGHIGQDIESSLLSSEVTPDWIWSGTDSLNFVHRRLPDAEIYWINSPVDSYRTAEVSLRVCGLKPYLWHPVSGEMKEIGYSFKEGRTSLTLTFDPYDAYFIVFKGKTETECQAAASLNLIKENVIEGGWDVTFEDKFKQKKDNFRIFFSIFWIKRENLFLKD